jgi:hypothetical protein
MTVKKTKNDAGTVQPTALALFFMSIESRTSDAIHLRLLKAAQKPNPATELERELTKIMEEILRET